MLKFSWNEGMFLQFPGIHFSKFVWKNHLDTTVETALTG